MTRLAFQTLACTLCMLFAGCDKSNSFKSPPPPPVTVVHPENRSFTMTSELPGRTSATELVEIRARVAGFLDSVDFKEGDIVEEGQLLFTIEPDQYESAVNMAMAELNSSQANDTLNREVLKKYQAAYDEGAATDVELIEARAKVDVSTAGLESAVAQLEKARLDLSYTRIHSPISGQISRLLVNKGNLVGSGSPTLLATVVKTDPMQVWVSVREADILEFRRQLLGENKASIREMDIDFTLRLPDGEIYPETGLIDFVDNTIDANTGTIDVRGTIPNPIGILKPGLFVRMEIESRQTFEGLMIPELAVMRDMAGEYVMVIDESDVVSRQGIVTARTKDHLTEVTDGLNAESKVIVNGLLQARPNQAVSPTLKTIDEAMKKLDPKAVAARALEISRQAFARMIEERTGRPAPELDQARNKTTATKTATETGT